MIDISEALFRLKQKLWRLKWNEPMIQSPAHFEYRICIKDQNNFYKCKINMEYQPNGIVIKE